MIVEYSKRTFPDFIFWLQKGNHYDIVYVDPKGTTIQSYQYKVDGYSELFEDETQPIIFTCEDKTIQVHLRLATIEDRSVFGKKDGYRKYWFEVNKFNFNLPAPITKK